MTDGAKGEPRNPASVYAAVIEGTQASAYRLSGDSSWPRPASPLPADEGLVTVPERTHRVAGVTVRRWPIAVATLPENMCFTIALGDPRKMGAL